MLDESVIVEIIKNREDKNYRLLADVLRSTLKLEAPALKECLDEWIKDGLFEILELIQVRNEKLKIFDAIANFKKKIRQETILTKNRIDTFYKHLLWIDIPIRALAHGTLSLPNNKDYMSNLRNHLKQYVGKIKCQDITLVIYFYGHIRGDLDNIIKPIMDVLKNFVFKGDDSLVTEIYALKVPSEEYKIKIGIGGIHSKE